jgi:transcriptional regulator with XRE-family HTH domain
MNKLKEWIDKHGIKQSWIAEKTGLSQGWINKLAKGGVPNVYDAQRIARVLNTTVEELWPLEDDK